MRRWTPLLVLMACLGLGSAHAAGSRTRIDLPVVRFATALDADRKADWISAYPCQGPAAGAYYCVQVSVSEWHSTQTLPAADASDGLRIVSRDVNGDQFPDILLLTTGAGRPIALWINDGHGGFGLADPSLFPARIWHDDPLLFPILPPEQFSLASLDGVQSFFLGSTGTSEPALDLDQSVKIAGLSTASVFPSYNHSGRAPPAL